MSSDKNQGEPISYMYITLILCFQVKTKPIIQTDKYMHKLYILYVVYIVNLSEHVQSFIFISVGFVGRFVEQIWSKELNFKNNFMHSD